MYSQIHALALFAPVAALMVILPGPDFVLISRTALAEGRARAQAAALGVACGILLHTGAAIIGLSAIIAGSPLLFGLLTWAGIVYLGWIGIASLRQGARMAGSVADIDEHTSRPVPVMTYGQAFRQGFLTNVLNPKAVLSFLTLLPQFMSHTAPLWPQFLALGGMLSLFCLVWFSTLSWLLGRIRRTFSGPVFQRRLHLGAGCVFLLCATLLFFFHAGRLF